MRKKEISKTERILSIFHLFRYCREISLKEIIDLLPYSKKTILRDISLLKQGDIIHIRYSKRLDAFIPINGENAVCNDPNPKYPEYKPHKVYLEKLIRLTTIMREADMHDDPAIWYKNKYSNLSSRTMQRDFAILRKIGYMIIYQRNKDEFEEHIAGNYYCNFPYEAYSLATFKRSI
ncbi:hypothetical protein [Anaerovorax odorimutans]|uniref:hypothetical protein n=1 Tax=Anaerovorax odorimutans TaxID=109327 RepID=UPI00042360C4|nr:hypothetical protein [Anaerovorax odorimutans]